jgi:hypothetical protein
MLSCLPIIVSFLFADGGEEEMEWEIISPPFPRVHDHNTGTVGTR